MHSGILFMIIYIYIYAYQNQVIKTPIHFSLLHINENLLLMILNQSYPSNCH